jgi:signal transduction histidine kinase
LYGFSIPAQGGQEKRNGMLDKPDILAGVSHEVRTQMNAIVAFSYLMNNACCTAEEKKDFSEQIISSCEQLLGLFDNFLDSASLETGALKPEQNDCDASQTLENLASEFRVIMRKRNKEQISLIQEDNLPSGLHITLDVSRVSRIMHSLFRNALDNTVMGNIRFGCNFRDNLITFYFKDSGQGFAKSKELLLSENPEKFISDNQDTYSAMNLILARNLLRVMRGHIRVEPNEPSGTSVYVTFNAKEIIGLKIISGINSDQRMAI